MTPRLENTILLRYSQQLPRLCLGPLKSLSHDAIQGPSTACCTIK